MNSVQAFLRKSPWIFPGWIWILLWLLPWRSLAQAGYSTELQVILDFASMGLALVLFMVPGAGFFVLFTRADREVGIATHLVAGFALSVLFAGILGIIGKIIEAPFSFVAWGLFLIGLGLIFGLYFFKIPFPCIDSSWFSKRALFVIVLILAAVLLGIFFAFNASMDADDASYLAYMHQWRSADHLSFINTIYGFETPESVRFWFATFPISQGVLADLGGLPSLLAYGSLLPPFLAILSLLSLYSLARRFSFSRESSAWVLLFYTLFMGLITKQPGFSYWMSGLSQDKLTAALIFFPVTLNVIQLYWNDPRRSRLIPAAMLIVALAVTHPIILSLSALIVGLMFILSIDRSNLLSGMVILSIFAASMLPFAFLRDVESRQGHLYSYTVDDLETTGKGDKPGTRKQISLLPDGSFYSINPDRLRLNFPGQDSSPWLDWLSRNSWYILAGLIVIKALTRFRSDPFARYALAVIFLEVLCLIPYTAWLIGFLITPPLISRVLWFFPYGFALVYLGRPWPVFDRYKIFDRPMLLRGSLSFFAVAFSVIVIPPFFLQNFAIVQDYRTFRNLINAGEVLDVHVRDRGAVLGSRFVNDFIPGVTSHAPVITFRNFVTPASSQMFSAEQLAERLGDRDRMLAIDTGWGDRLDLFGKYNLRFVLIDSYANKETAKLFEDLSVQNPQSLSLLWSEKRYRIYEIRLP